MLTFAAKIENEHRKIRRKSIERMSSLYIYNKGEGRNNMWSCPSDRRQGDRGSSPHFGATSAAASQATRLRLLPALVPIAAPCCSEGTQATYLSPHEHAKMRKTGLSEHQSKDKLTIIGKKTRFYLHNSENIPIFAPKIASTRGRRMSPRDTRSRDKSVNYILFNLNLSYEKKVY